MAWHAEDVLGGLPDRLTHPQVLAVAANVWGLKAVCRLFTMRVEDAARGMNGEVAHDYPLPVALAMVKRFSDTWPGCPETGCDAE